MAEEMSKKMLFGTLGGMFFILVTVFGSIGAWSVGSTIDNTKAINKLTGRMDIIITIDSLKDIHQFFLDSSMIARVKLIEDRVAKREDE